MKRILIMLVALGLLVAFVAPAAAAKPDKPGKPGPELWEVTLTGDLDTQLCGGTLIMEMDKKGSLHTGVDGPSVPRIFIDAAVPWNRTYGPEPLSGDSFQECHGGSVGGSMDWDGALSIKPTGDSVQIDWLFDHYWDRVPRNPNKPNGPTKNLIENFVLSGEASLISGNLYGGVFTIGLHGEEPFGSDYLEFTIQMFPVES